MVVVAFFVVFVISVFVCFFFSQNVTPLMETALNSGLSFIKHVDCGRGVSKEARKVLIKKTKKIAGFGNGNYVIWKAWRGKW